MAPARPAPARFALGRHPGPFAPGVVLRDGPTTRKPPGPARLTPDRLVVVKPFPSKGEPARLRTPRKSSWRRSTKWAGRRASCRRPSSTPTHGSSCTPRPSPMPTHPNDMLGTGPGRSSSPTRPTSVLRINCLGAGPSVTATQLELQAELGVRNVLLVGTAGGADRRPETGRDRAAHISGPSRRHLRSLRSTGSARSTRHGALCELRRTPRRLPVVGETAACWTTAAPFRTTADELAYYATSWRSSRRGGGPRRSSPSEKPATSELPPRSSSTVFRRRTAGGTSTSPRHQQQLQSPVLRNR